YPMDVTFFQHLFTKISDRGRQILDLSFVGTSEQKSLEALCHALTSSKGEASRVVLARQILDRYNSLEGVKKSTFFATLARDFGVDQAAVTCAAKEYLENQTARALKKLSASVESHFQELLRRLNMAPGGTASLVKMREDLLERLPENPLFEELDS